MRSLNLVLGSVKSKRYILFIMSLIPVSFTSFWISKWLLDICFVPASWTAILLQLMASSLCNYFQLVPQHTNPKQSRKHNDLHFYLQQNQLVPKSLHSLHQLEHQLILHHLKQSCQQYNQVISLSGVATSDGSTRISFLGYNFGSFTQWI